ncbi:MAG: glycosyltransferase family 39 protein [Phycisphaerae bacterium]|nr:glycosyltransferase family 39 protein [Phycisphaerae bacterium]
MLMLLAFNGQWRIGLDSANYRGLADSLANGRGYTFGFWAPKAIYPGFPLMLAGLQKLFGTCVFVPCIIMNLMSAAILWLTYLLVRLHYTRWLAVAVVFGVGTNAMFLELANELLTDIPFLLGEMIALYGWERLRSAKRGDRKWKWIITLIVGLAIAAVTRPTFWILLVSWFLVCVWGLIRGPRKLSAIALATMAIVWISILALDPRSHGFHILAGSPEREAMSLLSGGPETVRALNKDSEPHAMPTTTAGILWEKFHYVLHDQLPSAFFGERVAPCSILASLVVLASTLMLWRNPLWVLLIFITFAVTVLLSAEPRYYLMVLPLLALGWMLMLDGLLRIAPGKWGTLLFCGLTLLVEGNNIAHDVPIIIEQRSHPFLEHYRRGEYVPLIALAEQIRQQLPVNANVLGPSASVLSYLSGRHVWSQREIFDPDARPRVKILDYPHHMADLHFDAAVFPARLYWDKEPTIARLMDRRLVVATKTLYSSERLLLSTVEIRIPPGDWRALPKPPPRIVHAPKRKKKKKRTTQPATTTTTSATITATPTPAATKP